MSPERDAVLSAARQAGPAPTRRIVLLMERDDERGALAEWLAREYDVVASDGTDGLDEEFDLCIFDRPALEAHADALVARKSAEQPVALPYLLVVPERTLERGGGAWHEVDSAVREYVDEIVTTPIRKVELRVRVENLLGKRTLSFDLGQQRERHRRLLEVAPETILTLDAAGDVAFANAQATELFAVETREELSGTSLLEWIHEADRDRVREALEGDFGFIQARVVDAEGAVTHVELAGTRIESEAGPRTQVVVRDITERYEYEQEIERQRDVLEKLHRLNATIRDIDKALVGGSSREEIEAAVCDELAGTDRYAFAWVGRHRADSSEVEPRAVAGAERGYLDAVDVTTDEGEPAARAVEAGEMQVVEDVADADGAGWSAAALERDYRSVVSVPLEYEETAYGVLTIYATETDAFDERELAVLGEFGSTIAHAISAAESRRALLVDRRREVEFRVADETGFLARTAAEHSCAFDLQGVVTQSEGRFLEYYTTDVADPAAVVEAAREADDVDHVRHVGAHDDRSLFEFAFDEDLLVRTFGDATATIQDLHVEPGGYNLTAEVPYDIDLHTLVTAIEDRHESVTLQAQREAEQPLQTEQETRQAFLDRLTERQWTVLQTAYYAGYFDWPRESSGEEVAESLGISPSTFHEHLRTAQQKLLATLLE